MISIITPTFNSAKVIDALIVTLEQQTYSDFQWVIVDKFSKDKTLDKIHNSKINNKKIIQVDDFGIFHALNIGIENGKFDYYLFIGSDDNLRKNALELFTQKISKKNYDFVSSNYFFKGSSYTFKKSYFYPYKSIITSHLSTLINKKLHLKLGYYSKLYPVAADIDFFMKIYFERAKLNYSEVNETTVEIAEGGFSGVNILGVISEVHRIQLTYLNQILVHILFITRLIYHTRFFLKKIK